MAALDLNAPRQEQKERLKKIRDDLAKKIAAEEAKKKKKME